MSQKTRSKVKNDDSLIEKVRQLSPGSQASLNIVSTSFTSTPVRNGSPHDNVDLVQIHQLILEVKETLDSHKQTVSQEIRKLNDNFQAHLDDRITKLGDSLKSLLKDSIQDIQQYVDMEVGRINSQLQDIQTRVSVIEEKQQQNLEYDPEVSVIMSKVPMTAGEDIQKLAENIIHEGLGIPEIPIVRAMRLPQRHLQGQGFRHPSTPLVKVQLRDLDAKKRVLRSKLKLATTQDYANVWIRSSKSHIERLIDINFKTILDMIPDGNTMTVTNSGRITKKTVQN